MKLAFVALWMVNPVSLIELSFHVRLTELPLFVAVRLDGASGATANACACIMSISSWPSRWQCNTYSHPKLTRWLVTVTPLPAGSKNPPSGGPLKIAPAGIVGSINRVLLGTLKGSLGATGLKATMVCSSGSTLTVSFQPSSSASGGTMTPSQPTRLTSCTLYRWK